MACAPLAFEWNDEENWRAVPGYESYSISSHGRVRRDAIIYGGGGSVRVPRGFLRQRALRTGHLLVTLSTNNQPKNMLVHRLVAMAFLTSPDQSKQLVCHKDDNPANNFVWNLYWGDHTDNAQDMERLGTQRRGSAAPGAKLSADAVREIRERSKAGETQRSIAARLQISQSNVSMIVNGRTWGHI